MKIQFLEKLYKFPLELYKLTYLIHYQYLNIMNLTDLLISGFIGTIIMTMLMMMGKRMKLMPSDFDLMIDGLGQKMNDMLKTPNQFAYVFHFMIGTAVLPILYSFVWVGMLALPSSIIGSLVFFNIFGLIMIMMFPFLGVPSEWRLKTALGVIMGHVFYAIVFHFGGTLNF